MSSNVSLACTRKQSADRKLSQRNATYLESACVNTGTSVLCPIEAKASLNRQNTDRILGYTLIIAGAVAAGTGIALLVTHKKKQQPTATVWATPTPNGGFMGVHFAR